MGLEIIKSVRICDTFNLSLIYFESVKGYEVQYSNEDKILDYDGLYSRKSDGLLDYDGLYSRKSDGLKAFNRYLKGLIEVGV
jgi:hypothetical protein